MVLGAFARATPAHISSKNGRGGRRKSALGLVEDERKALAAGPGRHPVRKPAVHSGKPVQRERLFW
jgi:hypothetical protein